MIADEHAFYNVPRHVLTHRDRSHPVLGDKDWVCGSCFWRCGLFQPQGLYSPRVEHTQKRGRPAVCIIYTLVKDPR